MTDEISREQMLFETEKYSLPQFTFVPDGPNLLLGLSYGSRRTFLASVPIAEVGEWLVSNHGKLEPKVVPMITETVDDFLSALGLI